MILFQPPSETPLHWKMMDRVVDCVCASDAQGAMEIVMARWGRFKKKGEPFTVEVVR